MAVNITIEKPNRRIIARISGDLDHHTAKYIRSDIDSAIRENNPHTLVLDFSAVSFMDSSGIGLVMGRYKIMNELSGEVLIANTPSYIRKVMTLAGLDKLCKIISLSYEENDTADKNFLEVEQNETTGCK